MEQGRGEGEGVSMLDLTELACPMTFVRAKLGLEKLAPGDLVLVLLQGDEQILNVPRSIKNEGHHIEEARLEGDALRLLVRRGGQPPRRE